MKKGMSNIEFLMWIIGSISAVAAYAHMTFATYREVAPRLDRIENKIYAMIDRIKQENEYGNDE